MGIIRKATSFGTGGIVSFRNKQERATKYAKETRNAARAQVAQNAMQLELQRQQLNAADHANVREEVRDMRPLPGVPPTSQPPVIPQAPPAGWYPDQRSPDTLRWFDGATWTEFTQPRQ